MRVPKRPLGIRDFPYVKPGVRDFRAKWGRDQHGIRDAGNNRRDYWIAAKIWVGMTRLKREPGEAAFFEGCAKKDQ